MADKPIRQTGITITIKGIVTFSDTFNDQFYKFNQAMQKYLLEAFPDFKGDHPPITVTTNDILPGVEDDNG